MMESEGEVQVRQHGFGVRHIFVFLGKDVSMSKYGLVNLFGDRRGSF